MTRQEQLQKFDQLILLLKSLMYSHQTDKRHREAILEATEAATHVMLWFL